ncbi:hypothetical protein CLAFUW4_00339 [Fulvia fulva]|nr:hypothetical protein CLAFUR4_00339 [Fulvia fulva]WPV08952.1 hypothetical protein CLAFUW4_00339 [Fulvia fulva]WPV23778.1 hypothetical protein CLAFUW7_00343 [Fulvia fulva]
MSNRPHISRPIPAPSTSSLPPLPPPPPPPAPPPPTEPVSQPEYQASEQIPWMATLSRPLSDIRELSEPSLMDNKMYRGGAKVRHGRTESQQGSSSKWNEPRNDSLQRQQSLKAMVKKVTKLSPGGLQPPDGPSSSYSSTLEQSSLYTIPQSSVPRRSSSQTYSQPQRQPKSMNRNPSLQKKTNAPALASNKGFSIPNHGASQSPVKEAGLRLDPITADKARRIPSQTHVRSPHPTDILDFPSYRHPRVKLELQISAPVFVGGGSVEGYVRVIVDDNQQVKKRHSLGIAALSVDLLGFEEVDDSRRSTFLALGTELIDSNHPPPPIMAQASSAVFVADKFWSMLPSCSALPFMISLPLDTGNPTFQSKHASIRFLLSTTALIRDSNKHYRVRTSQDINVIPTYDPERALMSLPSPLTASDEVNIPRSAGAESVKLTAGLHRQVWVSGSSIFVDVHIANKHRKPIKRLELTLERDILSYRHAAPAAYGRLASQDRIFDDKERTVLARSTFKAGTVGWHGVEAHTSDTRTCELELPRGHANIRCGKYFEVRYFLNIAASLSTAKSISVQLPIVLIHMNSLDVVPNSVAQVAAAIEEKRVHRRLSGSRPRKDGVHSRQRSLSSPARTTDVGHQHSYAQGRAFAAPRQQSLDRQKEYRAEMDDIRHVLDKSPRKHPPQSKQAFSIRKMTSDLSLLSLRLAELSADTLGVFGDISYQTPPTNRGGHNFEEAPGLRDRLKRIGSLDSVRSKKSALAERAKRFNDQNIKPKLAMANQSNLAPHALGLTTSTRQVSSDMPSERSTSALSFRDKLDRSRFEFQAVRRKASGNLKQRSVEWLEQKLPNGGGRRDVGAVGWI